LGPPATARNSRPLRPLVRGARDGLRWQHPPPNDILGTGHKHRTIHEKLGERRHGMSGKLPITVARGAGIGPEIMDATLHIILEAGAPIEPEAIEIGEKVYLAGHSAGITDDAWESPRRTKVVLTAPITTPQGGGSKSL